MSVKNILSMESDAVTDQPVLIPFDFSKKDSIPEGKKVGDSIVVTPISVRTWFRIKPLLLCFDNDDLDKLVAKEDVHFDKEIADIMAKYDETIFDIICLGLYNKKGNMPNWFRDVLRDNCTWQDMYILLNAILFRIGCNPFLNTITAMRAVSPISEEEIIALQRNSKTWMKDQEVASCSL